ncbi:MAG TPA: anthranilate synthase component I family protein [Steroidobacteraceae bacterium]|nr:anthranilate synthase component I family protein [Steroidobacteraceae bacterium]
MKPPFDIAGDLDTPVSAFAKLEPFAPCFLLESVEGGERLGRYSFIGFGDRLHVRLDSEGLAVGESSGASAGQRAQLVRSPAPTSQAQLLSALRAALARAPQPAPALGQVPLAGGLVGYAAYDIVRYFERLPSLAAPLPDVPLLHYVAPRSLLVFDHVSRGIALLHAGSEAERSALRAEVIAALRGGVPRHAAPGRFALPTPALAREAYCAGVRRVQEYIAAGDVYQLVLASRFAGEHTLDPFQVYRALRLINPSPYMYFCRLDDLTVVGSSPEALVKLSAGEAELRPIAGTRPRHDDPRRDSELEAELRADAKENAEHVMLVDLARNDLGRVASAGSVRVEPYRCIERYSHVMHMVSGVRGRLAPGRDAFDLFAASFPAGTLVGAPKVRAMQIIEELEPVRRGLYGGTIGYFGNGGAMDQAITIRTLVFQGNRYSFQAGAGIVADSRADAEYDEVLAKGAALLRALTLAEEGL